MHIAAFIIIALIIGLVVGWALQRFWLSKATQDLGAKTELESTKAQFHDYQQEVARHLTKTAELLNEIESRYQAMQEHVYSAAQHLNVDSNKQSLLQPHSHYVSYGEKNEKSSGKKPTKIPKTLQSEKTSGNPPKDYV